MATESSSSRYGEEILEFLEERLSRSPGESALDIIFDYLTTTPAAAAVEGRGTYVVPRPSAALVFDTVAYGRGGSVARQIEEHFDVVARPGDPVPDDLRAGYVIIDRALGEGRLAHASVIADSPLTGHKSNSTEIPTLTANPSLYVRVFEGEELRRPRSGNSYRRIGDAAGRLPHSQILLRARAPADVEIARTRIGETAHRRGDSHQNTDRTYNSATEEIHAGTFSNTREYQREPRTGVEIEATMQLVCSDQSTLVDPKQLYQILSRDDWRVFRNIARCPSCAAFSSGFGVAGMPWDSASHKLREELPFVWVTVEPRRYDRADTRIERKVNLATDLMDDFYFDDDNFTLFLNSYVLRGRKRWNTWSQRNDPRISRLLIGTKKDTGVGPTGIKQGEKSDIRLPNGSDTVVRPRHIASLVDDIQSGFIDWNQSATSQARNRRAIPPIKDMYDDLRSRNALPRGAQGRQADVLDLKPQVFIRSLRSRYHLRETTLANVESILQNGESRLTSFRADAESAIQRNTLDQATKASAQEFVAKVSSVLDYTLVVSRTRTQIANIDPSASIDVRRLRRILPRNRRDAPTNHAELEKEKVVAEAIYNIYHELAKDLIAKDFANTIGNRSPAENDIWIRQIEAAGSAALGLWFDRARQFYVPASRRTESADFLIDTIDASGMFTPQGWTGISAIEQTNRTEPDLAKIFHSSLVNEIQIELGREEAYVRRIRELETQVGRTQNPDKRLVDNLNGARFVFEKYREALVLLAQMKRDQVIDGIKAAATDRRQSASAVPLCTNWGWEPVTQGKGESALSILKQQKLKPPQKGTNESAEWATK